MSAKFSDQQIRLLIPKIPKMDPILKPGVLVARLSQRDAARGVQEGVLHALLQASVPHVPLVQGHDGLGPVYDQW